ncbi:MAG: tetratricopeptide repeat protein [Cyanobacteria bacterium P01_F01_bin.150]
MTSSRALSLRSLLVLVCVGLSSVTVLDSLTRCEFFCLRITKTFAGELEQAELQRQADQLLSEGIEYYQVSQFPQALEKWQQALALYRQLDSGAGEAKILGNIGLIHNRLGDHTQALGFYEQSLAIAREIGDRATEAKSLTQIGNTHQLLGDYSRALDFHEQGLVITRDIGDRAGEGQTLGNISSSKTL